MKTKLFILALFAAAAFGQTALNQTTLTNAITVNQTQFVVGSTANITGCSVTQLCPIYVQDPGAVYGELMQVSSVPVSGTVIAQRGSAFRKSHVAGAIIVIANPSNRAQSFSLNEQYGACTAAQTLVTPVINTNTGNQWLCSTVTLSWVPGFQNNYLSGQIAPTAAVASAAGLITPSGPLFHITGTAAITGFTLPVGYVGGPICAIPDGVFTTTNANNIAIASTGVVGKTLCWTYDWNTSKFYPSY